MGLEKGEEGNLTLVPFFITDGESPQNYCVRN